MYYNCTCISPSQGGDACPRPAPGIFRGLACLLASRRSWRRAPAQLVTAAGGGITREEKKRCMPRPLTLTENLLAFFDVLRPVSIQASTRRPGVRTSFRRRRSSGLLVGQRWARLARSAPGAMRSARSRTSARTVHRSARRRRAAPGKPQGNTRAHQCHYPSQEKVCEPQ